MKVFGSKEVLFAILGSILIMISTISFFVKDMLDTVTSVVILILGIIFLIPMIMSLFEKP